MIATLDHMIRERATLRMRGHTMVCTNGVFDLLHYGHLQYLEAARALGDYLVIGLNSDDSTRGIKGPRRPLVPEAERAALLAALRPVDAVVIFDESTAERLVAALQPDIYVKGGDYAAADTAPGGQAKALPEAAIVAGYGGRVELIRYLPRHSTSELIELIKERYASPPDHGGGS